MGGSLCKRACARRRAESGDALDSLSASRQASASDNSTNSDGQAPGPLPPPGDFGAGQLPLDGGAGRPLLVRVMPPPGAPVAAVPRHVAAAMPQLSSMAPEEGAATPLAAAPLPPGAVYVQRPVPASPIPVMVPLAGAGQWQPAVGRQVSAPVQQGQAVVPVVMQRSLTSFPRSASFTQTGAASGTSTPARPPMYMQIGAASGTSTPARPPMYIQQPMVYQEVRPLPAVVQENKPLPSDSSTLATPGSLTQGAGTPGKMPSPYLRWRTAGGAPHPSYGSVGSFSGASTPGRLPSHAAVAQYPLQPMQQQQFHQQLHQQLQKVSLATAAAPAGAQSS